MRIDKKKRTSPAVVKAITLEQLRPLFALPLAQAAEKLELSETCLKRVCRRLNLERWPYRELNDVRRTILRLKNAEPSVTHTSSTSLLNGLLLQEQMLLNSGRSDSQQPKQQPTTDALERSSWAQEASVERGLEAGREVDEDQEDPVTATSESEDCEATSPAVQLRLALSGRTRFPQSSTPTIESEPERVPRATGRKRRKSIDSETDDSTAGKRCYHVWEPSLSSPSYYAPPPSGMWGPMTPYQSYPFPCTPFTPADQLQAAFRAPYTAAPTPEMYMRLLSTSAQPFMGPTSDLPLAPKPWYMYRR